MSSAAAADSVTEPPSRKRMHAVCQKRQNKPLIEKKRRARINDCLQQLKTILMKDLKKESPRPSKLEKADILEMTVDYIKKMADRKPESTDKECLTDKTTAATAGGMPFLNGFSRCLEEVDTFLHTQLPLQPEVRHKLLSHCKEQLSAKDLTVDLTPQRSSSLGSVSPAEDPPGGRHLNDCASDLASEDKDKLKPSSDGSGVGVTQTASDSPAATATAFVAPFMHTSSLVSCPQPNVQNTASGQNSGIKLAGPLKLICGGNVFIVVDQQQQPVSNCVTVAASVPPQSSPPSLSGQVICNPHAYSSSGVAAYIPAVGVPQMNTFAPAGVGLPVTSFPVTGPVTGCALNGSPIESATGTYSLHGSAQPELSPPFLPSPEDSPDVGNDINNNVVDMHAVWRPW